MTVQSIRKLLCFVAVSGAIGGISALANLSAAQEADDGYTEPGEWGEEAVLPDPVAGARLRSANKTCKLDLGPTQLDVTVDGHTHEPFDPRTPGDALVELRDNHQRLWMTQLRDLKPQAQIRAVCSTSPDSGDDETFTSDFMLFYNAPRATFACPAQKPYAISFACRTRRLAPTPPPPQQQDAGTADAEVTDEPNTDDQPGDDAPVEEEEN